MPASEKRNELAVGLFLFIGLVLLGGLILQFGRFKEIFADQYRITVVFEDASGLIKGSDVRMGGARIGRVTKLPELTDDVEVEAELAIDEDVRIPIGSSFKIESATLLGDKLIVINPSKVMTGAFIEPNTRLRGESPKGLEALQDKAEIVSEDVSRLLKEAEVTLGKIDVAVEEIQTASKELTQSLGKVNRSILADDNLAHFDTTLANLSEITTHWKNTSVKLDPALAEIRDAVATVKSAAANADETITGLQPAIKNTPAAVANISRAAKNASETLEGVNTGKGLLGALAADNDVSIDTKAFVRNLRRYGILRYRDKESPAEDDPRERFRGRRR